MTRRDLQTLAEERLQDAQALLAAGRFSGAYYLAGYAVECALKARIAKRFREFEFPDKRTVLESYTHILLQLARVAKVDVDARSRENIAFATNWTTVKDWTEESRYELRTEQQALELMEAITEPNAGVLAWLRLHW